MKVEVPLIELPARRASLNPAEILFECKSQTKTAEIVIKYGQPLSQILEIFLLRPDVIDHEMSVAEPLMMCCEKRYR